MSERKESLDVLKGIAILLVMFGHVQVHNHMTDPYLYDVIKSLQMPLFFLISGYLAGGGARIVSFSMYRERLGRRAVSYLLPFFSWLVLQHITYVPRALATVLFQLDYGLWFLAALFLFTWMAYTAQLLEARTGKEWFFWLCFLGSGVLILAAYLGGVKLLSPSLLVVYFPYYAAAYAGGRYPQALKQIPENVRRAAAYAGGAALLVLAAALDLVTVTGPLMLAVQTAASFLGCACVIRLVSDWRPCRARTGLARLGRCTLEIYVLHYQFATLLNPGGTVYAFWSPEGLLYAAAAFAVMSAVTAACIFIIDRVAPLRLLLFGKR